ncbi:hypothetical protein ACFFS4_35300 [Kutzneria kofuensis]|uniref:Uncharacterized protein n=1 Tax=Kutzneria kofuensis TaxID=103725 RepID=A0A7W9NES5_9PSEU|nr:hypothetical protein [Kutzneria kofuensis]MBB5890647.1 hypothetical protein [Kutzneria kofuensis]
MRWLAVAELPHRLSLVRRLAGLRRRFTAETTSSVLPAIVQALDPVDRTTRLQLIAALGDCSASVPAEVRQLVLPDAVAPEQRALEAGILSVANRLAPAAFRMARPLPDYLTLHVRAEARLPLLAALVPSETSVGLVGVAGLRVRPFRRHVELYLLGTTARVSLATVSYDIWRDAVADRDPAWLNWRQPPPLTDAELSTVPARHALASSIASSLLRRTGLFPLAPNVVASAREACQVDWSGGASTSSIAAALTHPLCGLPDVPARIARVTDQHLTIAVANGAASVALSGPDLTCPAVTGETGRR